MMMTMMIIIMMRTTNGDGDGARREAVQVRGDSAHLQGGQLGDGRRYVRRLHGGVQDVRPRGSGIHRRRRTQTRAYVHR